MYRRMCDVRRAAERLATQSFPVAFPVSRAAHRLKWRGTDVRNILRNQLASRLVLQRSERQQQRRPRLSASALHHASNGKRPNLQL